MPVRAGKEAESGYQGQEDHEEDDVRPQGADQIDEAEETHSEQEEREASVEADCLQAILRRRERLGAVETVGVIRGLEGGGEGEPEGAKGGEDDEREGVADEPLEAI